jgi:hypothetical protein
MRQQAEYRFALKSVKNIKLQVLDIIETILFPETVPSEYNLMTELEIVKDKLIKLEAIYKELYDRSKEK